MALRRALTIGATVGCCLAALGATSGSQAFASVISISSPQQYHLTISNGNIVAAGYSFKIPGSHTNVEVLMAEAVVTFRGTCSNHSPDNAFTVPLRAGQPSGAPWLVPAGSSVWHPSESDNAPESYQGSGVANVCGGTGGLDIEKGGISFRADVQASPTTQGQILVRFHYRIPQAEGEGNVDCSVPGHEGACHGSWSETGHVSPPDPIYGTPSLSSSASVTVRGRPVHAHARPRSRRSATLGATIYDTATLADGRSPTGTITFDLYGPHNTGCSGVPVFESRVAVVGNGDYQSAPFIPTEAGTYRWVVTYSGDANNAGAGPTACDEEDETVVVERAQPSLSSTASGVATRTGPRGGRITRMLGTIYDTAHLSGGVDATGTISFSLYGPDDENCSRTPVFTDTVPVSGNGDYPSASFSPPGAGTYRWVVSYSGDSNNAPPGPTACGDPAETVVVPRDQPSLTSTASGTVEVGGSVHDTAQLIGGTDPTETISFTLYGPDDETCSRTPVFSDSVPVSGSGDYTSGSFTPIAPGTYRWVVSYSGDPNNLPAGPTACSEAAESVVVTAHPPARPTLTSTASTPAVAGSRIYDTAHLSGGDHPRGTISFRLYGPGDASCSRPVFSDSVPVFGNGDHRSAAFVPADAGTYRWVVSYSGDMANAGAGPTACGEPTETVSAAKAQPRLRTIATRSVRLGRAIRDTVLLSVGSAPTGTIYFHAYGPRDHDCTGPPAFGAQIRVPRAGFYTSPTFTPKHAGTYHWIAAYSGDANNHPAGPNPCGARRENSTIRPARPRIFSLASGAMARGLAASAPAHATGGRIGRHPHAAGPSFRAAGLAIYDTVHLSLGHHPGGFIHFALYGPDDASCSGTPAFVTQTDVSGNGDYYSESFTPTASGTYRWVVSYSGDANNAPAGPTACGEAAETVAVSLPAKPTLSSSASGAVDLGEAVHDTAYLSGGSAATGTIAFRLYGPDDETCSGTPVFSDSVAVSGDGAYPSSSFTPPGAGSYRWVLSYSGDSNNLAAGPTVCTDPAELVEVRKPSVTPAQPTLSTTVGSATAPLGTPIYDTAHLVGGSSPTGTVTFSLYGPDDETCAKPPVFTAEVSVSGAGNYPSQPFVVTAPGTYRWVASYSGDMANAPAGPSSCGEPAEVVTVAPDPSPNPDPNPNPPLPPIPPHPTPPTPPTPPKPPAPTPKPSPPHKHHPKPKPSPPPPPPAVTG